MCYTKMMKLISLQITEILCLYMSDLGLAKASFRDATNENIRRL